MQKLQKMPPVVIPQNELAVFGETWHERGGSLSRTPPQSSSQLGGLIDKTVGEALAVMLGNIPIVKPNSRSLTASHKNCVEVGPVRVAGGIRNQNFDVGYRPDEIRFAFDSKTLNDTKSVGKNWQNMVNDIATEATTVHCIFPNAVVAFIIAVPFPCINQRRRAEMIDVFERLARRTSPTDQSHLAEAISFVLWNPEDGSISNEYPALDSHIRIEKFSSLVEAAYVSRYGDKPIN